MITRIRIKRVENVFRHLESFGARWGNYLVMVEDVDGDFYAGTMQGDGESLWDYETFEPED